MFAPAVALKTFFTMISSKFFLVAMLLAISMAEGTISSSSFSSVQNASVFRKLSSTYLPSKFRDSHGDEMDVYQADESTFSFARGDGLQFVSQDLDVREIVTKLDQWNKNVRTLRVKTKTGELQWHMTSHMRSFLRKVLPPHIKAYDVKFRALPTKGGNSPHQNDKAELHQDFNQHDFRLWLPRQRLNGGFIVSPSAKPPFQLYGGSADVGDAWIFHSGMYHGPAPWEDEPAADRGFIGTVSFCTYGEGSCWKNEEEQEEDVVPSSPMLLA
ncbi:unnamed protein product [Polarella glacialis]|uniref:Uncharacterized protein n=1 Tax=Polarella glacialis TaxID=89957 RepID=A0A813ERY5_POLGL|nr:unnamed protein product [Polarella glacialis]